MKTGANLTDQAQIRRLKEAGLKPAEISKRLKVNLDTVKSFCKFDQQAFDAEEKARQAENEALAAEKAAVARAAGEAAAAAVTK